MISILNICVKCCHRSWWGNVSQGSFCRVHAPGGDTVVSGGCRQRAQANTSSISGAEERRRRRFRPPTDWAFIKNWHLRRFVGFVLPIFASFDIFYLFTPRFGFDKCFYIFKYSFWFSYLMLKLFMTFNCIKYLSWIICCTNTVNFELVFVCACKLQLNKCIIDITFCCDCKLYFNSVEREE